MVHVKLGGDSDTWVHIDPDDVQPGQKLLYCVWVKEYFQDPKNGDHGDDYRILEDEDFETEAERDARFEQLELKYPGAEINAY
jgi:hypothetical protein